MDANAFPVLYASHDGEIMKSKSGHWNRRTTNRGGGNLDACAYRTADIGKE